MASERRLRRLSQVQPRANMPKRSVSLRRAYNYVFRRERSPGEAPAVQDTTTHQAQKIESEPRQSEHEARISKSRSPQSRVEFLEKQLQQSRKDLVEAREVAVGQDAEIESLEQRMRAMEEEYTTKQEALSREKATIEENMVTVVIDQIKAARAEERATIEAEGKTTRDAFEHKFKSRVAILTQELENSRAAHQTLQQQAESEHSTLRAERATLLRDLERAKSTIAEVTETLSALREASSTAIEDARQQAAALKDEYQKSASDHDQRYEALQNSSAASAEEASNRLAAVKDQLESQTSSHITELQKLQHNLESSQTSHGELKSAIAVVEGELADARSRNVQLEEDLRESKAVKDDLATAKAQIATLNAQVEELDAAKHALKLSEAKLVDLTAATQTHEQAQMELIDARKHADETTASIKALTEEHNNLKVHSEDLQKKLSVAEDGLKAASSTEDKLTRLQDVHNTLEQELQASQTALEAAKTATDGLIVEKGTLTEKLAVAIATQSAAEKLAAMGDEATVELKKQLETATAASASSEEISKKLAALEAEKQGLVSERETVGQELADAKAALEAAKQESNDKVTESHKQLEEAQKSAEAARAAHATDQARLAELEASASNSEEVDTLRGELSSTKSAHDEIIGKLASLEAEAEASKTSHAQELDDARTATKTAEAALEKALGNAAAAKSTNVTTTDLEEELSSAKAAQKTAEAALAQAQADAESTAAVSTDQLKALQAELDGLKASHVASTNADDTKQHALEAAIASAQESEQKQKAAELELESMKSELESLKAKPALPTEPTAATDSQASADHSELNNQLAAKDAEIEELKAWKAKTVLELRESLSGPAAKTPAASSDNKGFEKPEDTPPVTPAADADPDGDDIWDSAPKKKKGKGKKKKNGSAATAAGGFGEEGEI
jgi:chromosome segregation ATPase